MIPVIVGAQIVNHLNHASPTALIIGLALCIAVIAWLEIDWRRGR